MFRLRPKLSSRISVYNAALIAALLITAAVYFQTTFFEFTYDDLGQIVHNPRIKSWSYIWNHFSSHVWAQNNDVAIYYRPIFLLWLTGNYKLFGLNPVYWHLATIVLHILACLLLYFFINRLTKNRWISVVAVLLFGLHPIHVESVAWISGATDPLLAVLFLGSLLCYLRHKDREGEKLGQWLVASLVLAFLSTLAKEAAVVLPAIIFSYEWIFEQEGASRRARLFAAVRAATPYAITSLGFLIIRALAMRQIFPPGTHSGRAAVVLAWPQAISFYISHLLLPLRLTVFYKAFSVTSPGLASFVLPLLLVTSVAAGLLYWSRHSRVIAFFSAWCAIMLVPLLSPTLLPLVENVHDRYLYVSSAAFCAIIAVLLERLKRIGFNRTAVLLLAALAASYALITVRESRYWTNNYELARHGIGLSPGHPIALLTLGNSYMREGRMEEALPYLWDSLKAEPSSLDTLCSLVLCYSALNAPSAAEECITKALALKEAEPRVLLYLGIVRLEQNRLDEAEAAIRRAMKLDRVRNSGLPFHYHLGNVLYAKGDVKGALREYRREILNDAGIPDYKSLVDLMQIRVVDIEQKLRLNDGL